MTEQQHGPFRPSWLAYWHGRWRLQVGPFCPLCNSSPPRPGCLICKGTHDYSYRADPWQTHLWRVRWDALRAAASARSQATS